MRISIIICLTAIIIGCGPSSNNPEGVVTDNAILKAIKPRAIDTINFTHSDQGLNYSFISMVDSTFKADSSSHVAINFKVFDKENRLLSEHSNEDKYFQLYVRNCEIPLAEALCMLTTGSEMKVLIDGKSVQPLYSEGDPKENYLVQLKLIDFHRHFD